MLLAGCGAEQTHAVTLEQAEANLSQAMEAHLCVEMPDITAEGDFQRTGPEMYSFKVTNPAQLEGLCMTVEGEQCSFSYQGMNLALQTDCLPAQTALKILNEAMDAILRREEVTLKNDQDGGGTLIGTAEGMEYQMQVDADGKPIAFTVPKLELKLIWIQPQQDDQNQTGS